MEIRKASALATLIAIVSCKMKQEGLYELKNGNVHKTDIYIKYEFIVELWDKFGLSKQHGCITREEAYNIVDRTFFHNTIGHEDESGKKTLYGAICPENRINEIFNEVHIQPLQNLIQDKHDYMEINPVPDSRHTV